MNRPAPEAAKTERMQVNLATSASSPVRGVGPNPTLWLRERTGDRVEFRLADVLQRALEQAPDIRPEALLRAGDLFQQVPYPPGEIIQGISRLLAKEWTSTET